MRPHCTVSCSGPTPRPCSTSAGSSAIPTAGRTTPSATSPPPCMSISRPSSPGHPPPSRGVIRCRSSTRCSGRRGAGVSVRANVSSSTTTSAGCRPPGPGGCCAGRACPASGSSTARSRRWLQAGLPIESGELSAEPGDVVLEAGRLPVLDADQAAEAAQTGVLLDARAGERYRGEQEPIDPRAGHIPGAVSMPSTANLGPDGRFLDADDAARAVRGRGRRRAAAARRVLRLGRDGRASAGRAADRRL